MARKRRSSQPAAQSPLAHQEEAFLQTIREAPDDDGARLIYADWLEDNGQPDRSEFIRVQIQLTRLPADAPEREPLASREKQLYQQHNDDWTAGLVDLGTTVWKYERGIAHSAHSTTGKFVANAEQVFRLAPLLRDMRLSGAGKYRQELAALPYLAQLTGLSIIDGTRPTLLQAGALALAASPYLTNLERLELHWTGIGDRGLAALAQSPAVARLESLALEDNRIGLVGLTALAQARPLGGFTELDLSRNPLRDAAMIAALAHSHTVPRLRNLNLQDTNLSDNAAAALAAAPQMAALESLRLDRNLLGGAGLGALADSPHLTRLKNLEVSRNGVGDAGVTALAQSEMLTRLTHLDLFGVGLTDAGALALVQPRRPIGLEVLLLGANVYVGDQTALVLAASPHLGRLRHLSLMGTGVTRQGVEALVRSPHLAALRVLEVAGFNPDTESWDETIYADLLDELHTR
jgi:uncharacterized protein (TIGR02996 family)